MKVYGPDSVLLVTINVITIKDAKAYSGNLSCLKSSGGGGGGGGGGLSYKIYGGDCRTF